MPYLCGLWRFANAYVTLALGVTVTMLGLKAIGSDEDLPQLDDENQNVA